MSSSGNAGTDNRETSQERHPVDLASKTTLKTTIDCTRSSSIQAGSQLRSIGTAAVHSVARVQSSGIQTVVTSSTTSQITHGTSASQMSLKQGGVSRNAPAVCSAVTAATLVQGTTLVNTRPSLVPATSPLPIQSNSTVSSTHVSTTYHVPRGAAAVANIAAPRSAVATPIVRATANLQSAAGSQHTTSFASGLRGLGSSTLLPRAPSPAAQGATWLSGNIPTAGTTTIPKCVSPGPMLTSPRTPTITTIQQYTQGRSTSMTVTARPLTPQGGRMQSESPRPQLIHASAQKPIAATQTATQLHIGDKGFFKPSVSVQSSLGGVSIAQVLPARTQASPLTYSNPLSTTNFPVTSGTNQGTTTLIAAQPQPLTLSQAMVNTAGGAQGATTVLTAPPRLTVSNIPAANLSTQGTATTPQRSGQVSNAVFTTPARLSVSTANQGSGASQVTTRVTVAAGGLSQSVGLPATVSSAGQGTIIASTARITTLPSSVLASAQGTTALLTGPTRLTMTSSIPVPGQNAVLPGQTRLQAVSSSVSTALAAPPSGAMLATSTRIAVSANSAGPPSQQTTGVLASQARLTVAANSSIAPNSGQNALITGPTRLAVSSNSSVTPTPGQVLATQARLTVTSGVPSSALPSAGVVSLHPLVVSNTNPSLSLKPSSHNQLGSSGSRNIATHQNLGPKVITQPAHGPPIQITQVPVSSVSGKLPQSLHSVTPLQTAALAITTGANRTVTYAATATVSASNVSNIRPVTVATTSAIPVAKVFPQAVGVGREQIGTNSVSEVTLPVHAIQASQATQQSQQAIVASQQTISQATSVYIQTSHRTSPAPSSTQASVDRTSTTLPTYSLPTTYYYETPSGYQVAGVGGSLVARPYNPGSPYTVQTTTTPALRPGVTAHQVHGIVAGAQPVRFNPVMVVDPTRTSLPVHPPFVEGTLVQTEGTVLGQSNQMQTSSKPNASPRPSILRKRDNEGSPMKAQKNLAPVLAALSSGAPVSPPSPRRPDSRGNGGNSSGGSTTISATSSPGLGEAGDDSLPPIKQEPVEEGERPPVEMSPRKKPRKQQLTGNELHEPKFSEDEMEFMTEEKIKKEVKEVSEDYEEKIYIPKRPNISLINSYRHTWKSRHNHYLRYSDVKPKDERRPTVTDLANQKQVLQKLNGWKIYHLSTQMEDLSELEMQVFEKLSAMLKVMEKKSGKELDKDVNRVNELIKGNIQRSKVIKDQMQEAKSQVMKIFDHKNHVTDIISRCANKRSLKKRDKS